MPEQGAQPGGRGDRHRGLAVAVDIVIFTVGSADLMVLLIKRRGEPFAGRWAIPGGFVEEDEALDDAAARELPPLAFDHAEILDYARLRLRY